MKFSSKLLGIAMCTLWVFAIFQNSYGQEAITWMKTYGGNTANLFGLDIAKCDDGGYMITGISSPDGMFIMKVDANGDSIWAKSYGESGIKSGCYIEQTTTEDFIIVGMANTPDTHSICYLKIDGGGDTIWIKTFEHKEGYCVDELSLQQTDDEGFILSGGGHHHLDKPNWKGGFIIKTNQDGDTLWTRKDTTFYVFHSIQQTTNGGYIMIGGNCWYGEDAVKTDNHLVKTDSEGNIIWKRNYGGDSGYWNLLVDKTAEGGYILLQNIRPDTIDKENIDIQLIKTDAEGDTLWTKSYGGELVETGDHVLQTSDGGYIICAKTRTSYYDDSNIWLIKTNAEGDSIWTRTFYDTFQKSTGKIIETDDGGYIILDRLKLSEAIQTILIKTDSNGNVHSLSIEEEQRGELSVYPNPTNKILTIETEYTDHYSIEITSLNGQLIYSTTMEGTSHEINLSSFQKGVYFITIRSEDFVTTKKIIKL